MDPGLPGVLRSQKENQNAMPPAHLERIENGAAVYTLYLNRTQHHEHASKQAAVAALLGDLLYWMRAENIPRTPTIKAALEIHHGETSVYRPDA